MQTETNLLIIGAGPFGLAAAAYARHLGIDTLIVGKPMGFWRDHMPEGMLLRSACDWHLDPLGIDTIEAYLQTQNLRPADVEPLSRQFYLGYVEWFQQRKQIEPAPYFITRLDAIADGDHRFQATTGDGQVIRARHVVVAVGFEYFVNVPADLAEFLPAGRFSHTCHTVDFAPFKGKRVLIVGGRQSAFEWAALLHETGAAAVHITHRHATPAFAASDWSWALSLVESMVDNPGFFRGLPQEEKDDLAKRLWVEGRLKLEPWLKPRINKDSIRIWPLTEIANCEESPSGELSVLLDNGQTLTADHIILATGYKVQMDRIPFLAQGSMMEKLSTRNGFPVLDEHFQTDIPGLYVTSMPAGQDFGPFFGFTVSVRTSARLIGQAVAAG